MTPDTWAEKLKCFARINSIRKTNRNFDSCNSCKRLGTSRLHLHFGISLLIYLRSASANCRKHALQNCWSYNRRLYLPFHLACPMSRPIPRCLSRTGRSAGTPEPSGGGGFVSTSAHSADAGRGCDCSFRVVRPAGGRRGVLHSRPAPSQPRPAYPVPLHPSPIGLDSPGPARSGQVQHDTAQHGTAQHGTTQCDTEGTAARGTRHALSAVWQRRGQTAVDATTWPAVLLWRVVWRWRHRSGPLTSSLLCADVTSVCVCVVLVRTVVKWWCTKARRCAVSQWSWWNI